MFSFVGDTVVDPFCGTGTTMIAAVLLGRNSIGVEIDRSYFRMAARRIKKHGGPLFMKAQKRLGHPHQIGRAYEMFQNAPCSTLVLAEAQGDPDGVLPGRSEPAIAPRHVPRGGFGP